MLNHIATTEQIIRENFTKDETIDVYWVENLSVGQKKVMQAHVIGSRQLAGEEIRLLEGRIREATKDDSIELIISTILRTLSNSEGLLSENKINRYFDSGSNKN